MKKHKIHLVLAMLIGWCSFAQSPNWQVNENDYQYTMSFVAFLNIDGQDLDNTNDQVAAFVNGACRGVTNLTYVASENGYYAYLTVFSNTNGETIEFKMYDASNDVIRDVDITENFEINQHYGDLFQAFSIASPPLSSEADLISFDFVNTSVNDLIFDGNEITIYLDETVDRTALNAVYEISSGAKLYLDREEITSGSNSLDYTDPISFETLSEDKSVRKTYTVLVNISSDDFKFYKKDAVCYNGGAIKITSLADGEEIVLLKDDVVLESGTLSNGQFIFNDLVTGTYTVKVSGNSKAITINQKN